MSQNNDVLVYAGTYTKSSPHVEAKSEGIYIYRLDLTTGALSHVSTTSGIENPSFLAIHPNRRFLYTVNELMETDGAPTGGVSAFAIDPADGGLTFLNWQPSHGTAPCHINVDATGAVVLVANYMSGTLATYPVQTDGSLGEACMTVQHEGSSVNPERQEGPHAHSISLSADNCFAFAADLGMDKVMLYRLQLESGQLEAHSQPSVSTAPGAGPRHFAFHPSNRYAYVINEMASTVTAFAYDESAGTLSEVQTISTLPDDFEGRSSTADIHVHPSGKFLYGSNRGHDSIAIFAIAPESGKLTVQGHESTQGAMPRNFALDPTGAYLLAANQNSDTVVSFRINQETGALTPTGHVTSVPTPVCLKMMRI